MTAPTPATPPAPDPTAPTLLCGHCGYDLRSATGRCTECGRPFDPAHTIDALIPWEQRRHIGRLGRARAYVRTVLLATFRPKRVARYVDRPVSLTAARTFRRVTVVLTFLAVLASALLARATATRMSPDPRHWRYEPLWIGLNPWSFGIAAAGLLAGFSAATRLTAWMFDHRRLPPPRRRRAAALGHYACAPLALLVVAAPLIVTVWWLAWEDAAAANFARQADFARQCAAVASSVAGALGILWLAVSLRLLRAATGCRPRRLALTGLVLPPLWGACLLGIPLLALLLAALFTLACLSLFQ